MVGRPRGPDAFASRPEGHGHGANGRGEGEGAYWAKGPALPLRLEGEHIPSRERFLLRPLESRQELETIRKLRYPLYRWKAPYPPETDATLDELPVSDRRYFAVTVGNRCMGGAAVWVSDGRLEGFDLGKDAAKFARIGRLVLHPACVGRTLVITYSRG